MKKITAFLVAFTLFIGCFVCLTFENPVNALTPGEVTLELRETFAQDKKGEFEKANDGYIGIPVVLTTFVRESATFNKATILYVVGANIERVGTDTDEEIINDLLDEGYAVTVIDYLGNPLATGTPLSYSLMLIQSGDVNANKYTCGYKIDTMYSYCLPAGYRIDRDVYFYSLDTMALNGSNEYIVWLWNNYYAGEDGVYKDAQGNDLPYAETIYDCIKKDGSPMYFDLDMDIIYPANPSDDTVVPVMAHASNCETRVRHISRNDSSTVYHIQGLIEGYASVVYDHEYIPMSRNDHYGYYGNYTLPYSSFSLSNTNANAVHSAAIRRIRYLADTYGYDSEYIGVTGFSKSGLGPGILADTTHEQRGEMKNFADYCPEGVDPDAYIGEQPWLTYDDGTPISSNVTTVYSGAGGGVCTFGMINVNENCVPFASTIGTEDTTGSFRTYIDRVHGYFDNTDIESLYYNPVGLAHFVAWGYNYEFQRENVDIVWSFLDNHIRAAYREEAPEVLYMTPKNGVLYDEPQKVTLKFSRAMNLESVENNAKITRESDGKEITGIWSTAHGNTTYTFVSSQILNGDTYIVTLPKGTKAADGVETDIDFIKTFSIAGDLLLEAEKDTYVSSALPEANFGTAENMVVSNTEDGEEIGLVSFKRDSAFTDVNNASLIIDKTDTVKGGVAVYAKNGTFDENNITYADIDKDEYTFIGISGGDNTVTFDVSEFLKGNNSSEVTFMLVAPLKKGDVYSRDFENDTADTFKQNTHYAYGAGAATMSFTDGTIYLTGRSNGNRLKFIDGLGKSSLDQSDLGVMYTITAKVKADEDAEILVGLYAQSGTIGYNPYGNANYSVKGGEWTTLEHTVTITQQMIDYNTDCVTLVPAGTVNYAIDEIKVEISSSGGTFATKESSINLLPATLALWTPEKRNVYGDLSVIGSGKDRNTVLTESFTVNADGEEDCSATKKGYIKVPLSSFDLSAETVNFEFPLGSAVNNKVSVYGLLDDETKFAENFDGNITWNTAYANSGNGADKSKVYGGAPLATVSAVTDKISIDVKEYVTYMKNKGYNAVTFMLVAENSDTVTTLDFEGFASYDKIVKSSELQGFSHTVRVDPADGDNSAFYFEKSGSGAPNGYQQTLSFTGLIDDDNLFTSDDIGSVITVTFRQYNEVSSEHPDCVDFGKIGKAGTATSALANLSYVTKTLSQNGKAISANVPMNEWYDVKYVINVTADAVANYAEHNSIVIANGWTASGVYIDDIVVSKTAGDVVISSADDTAPVENTDFENGEAFTNYSANSYMSGYEIAVKADPTAENNNVLYIAKSGSTSPSGYHQNVALINLIKKNGVFTEDDIGNVYTITFRQYNSVSSEHADCYDFGNIAAPGTATSALSTLPFVTKTMTYQGTAFTTQNTPMNDWYDVKYTLTVTEEAVASYSTSTAIVLATGWTGNGIYIDDINIDVEYAEKENSLGFVPVTNFTDVLSFDNAVKNTWLSKWDYESGITADPTDSTNNVYFFDKSGNGVSGTNSYLENMAITGLIKTDNVFAADDVGKVYTVKYRQYNVVPEGAADCKDFSVIGVAGTTGTITSGHYNQPEFVTSKKCYYNGTAISTANVPMNAWYDVVFKFTVTETVVENYSNYTSILIACGITATRCYLDDIRVSVEGVSVDFGSLPGIVYDNAFKDNMTVAAVIDAAAPDKNGKTEDVITLQRTAKTTSDGMRKVYATIDKTRMNHIQYAALSVTVNNPTAGNTLYVYGLDSAVNTENLTWNSAYGNDIETSGVVTSVVYGSAPLAVITLTEEVTYTVLITDYLKSIELDNEFTVVITGEKGDGATEISEVSAYIMSTAYDDSESVSLMVSPKNGDAVSGKTKIASRSENSIYKNVEKVEFYIDGALFEGYVEQTGDVSFAEITLSEGEHTVYAVYTYSDSTTATSETVTFNAGEKADVLPGDVDGNGCVDTGDLAGMKLYLAGVYSTVGEGADINNDGKVDSADLASLKLELAGV